MSSRIFLALLQYSYSRVLKEAITEWICLDSMSVPIVCLCVCGQPHKWMTPWKNVRTGKQVPVGKICSAKLEKEIENILAQDEAQNNSNKVRAGYIRDGFVTDDDQSDNESDFLSDDESDTEYESKYDEKSTINIVSPSEDIAAREWKYDKILDELDDKVLVRWSPIKVSVFQMKQAVELWSDLIERIDSDENMKIIYWKNQWINYQDICM